MGWNRFSAALELDQGYAFDVTIEGDPPIELTVDESRPLGEGAGPSPASLLATAVGQCLGSSLLFCLKKAKVDVQGMAVRVEGTYTRNEKGRIRIGGLSVHITTGLTPEQHDRAERCLELFQDYCIVTESVRSGFPIAVTVHPTVVAAESG